MMSLTHCALAVTATSLVMGTAEPMVLLTAALASQLPDVDTSKSVPGRILFPFSRFLEKRYPHRSVTHSFLATVVIAGIALPMVLVGLPFYLALVSGYFWGWFGDVFTKSGVCAFYPSQIRAVCPGNPRLRLSTNSGAERFLLVLMIVIAVASFNINSSGGILRGFNQMLGFPEGAVEIANTEGHQYLLVATIQGRNRSNQQPVAGEFEIVKPLTQSDLLVSDQSGLLYRVGSTQECQIQAHQIRVTRGRPIRATVQQLTLQDEAIDSLEAVLAKSTPRTFITGTLTIRDAEDLIVADYADRFNPIRLQPLQGGAAIARIEAASPQQVLRVLGEFEGSGSLLVRRVEVL
jgi:inner membrane protein